MWGTRIVATRSFDGAAVEIGEAELAVETETRLQGFAGCGIERWHAALLHDNAAPCRSRGDRFAEDLILRCAFIDFKDERTRAAQSSDLVENAVGELALGHLGHFDGGRRG